MVLPAHSDWAKLLPAIRNLLLANLFQLRRHVDRRTNQGELVAMR